MAKRRPFRPQATGDDKLDRIQQSIADDIDLLDQQHRDGLIEAGVLRSGADFSLSDAVVAEYTGNGGHTLRLPTAASLKGRSRPRYVCNTGHGTLTVRAAAGDRIGDTEAITMAPGRLMVLVCDGVDTWTGSSGGSGGGVAVADWTGTRFFAVDGAAGNDANLGYSDSSQAEAFHVAKKTWAGAMAVLPRNGNFQDAQIGVMQGTYDEDLILAGVSGYQNLHVVACTTGADDDEDRILSGFVVAEAGPGGSGEWTVDVATPAGTAITVPAAILPAEPAAVLRRLRFTGNVTPALANACTGVLSNSSLTIDTTKDLPGNPDTGDTFFIEKPGTVFNHVVVANVSVDTLFVRGIASAGAIVCASVTAETNRWCGCEAATAALWADSTVVSTVGQYVPIPGGPAVQLGLGVRAGAGISFTDIQNVAAGDSSGALAGLSATGVVRMAWGDGCAVLSQANHTACGLASGYTSYNYGRTHSGYRDLRQKGTGQGCVVVLGSAIKFAHVYFETSSVSSIKCFASGNRIVVTGCRFQNVINLASCFDSSVLLDFSATITLFPTAAALAGGVSVADTDLDIQSIQDENGNLIWKGNASVPSSVPFTNRAIRFINSTGGSVVPGTCVRVTGETGGVPSVGLSVHGAPSTAQLDGVVVTTTENGATGYMVRANEGSPYVLFDGAVSAGDDCFISTTAGKLTNVAPAGSAVRVGKSVDGDGATAACRVLFNFTAAAAISAASAITAVSAGGVSLGAGGVSFADAHSVSFGVSAGSTITASVPPYTTVAISAPSGSANAGTIVWANSNGVTFGWNASTITASVTTQNPLAVSAAGGSASSGTVTFGNANSVSFGYNAGSITASVAPYTTHAISAGTTSQNAGTIVFSNANGVSFGMAGSTVTASVTVTYPAATTVALSASGGSANSGTISFVNSNGVSFGYNASSITASVTVTYPAATTLALSAGTTSFNAGTVSFVNANGVSFGLASSSLTASVTVTYPAATTLAISASGGSANSGTFTFANSNGYTFGYNASSITVRGPMVTAYEPFIAASIYTATTSSGQINMSLQRFVVPLSVSATRFEFLHNMSHVGSSQGSMTWFAAIYTQTGSTLTTASSVSWSTSWLSGNTNTSSGGYLAQIGWKFRTAAAAWNFPPGEYWLGAFYSGAAAAGNLVFSHAGPALGTITLASANAWFNVSTATGSGTNFTEYFVPGLYGSATGAFPGSITYGQINATEGQALVQPYFKLVAAVT